MAIPLSPLLTKEGLGVVGGGHPSFSPPYQGGVGGGCAFCYYTVFKIDMYTSIPYCSHSVVTTGILLVNLGTPEAPTPAAVRRYLAEFLADPRVTELPRWLWWLILHGIILRFRPGPVAQKYQKIWTAQGSPLLSISQAQVQALQQVLINSSITGSNRAITVALGMRYGNPSIAAGLEQLRQAKARRIIILPLYPQYSSPTTGSTFDAVSTVLKQWRWVPEIHFISHYYDHPAYIQALATHIQNYWHRQGIPDKLLFSFHGVPKRFWLAGDPYSHQCHQTAEWIAHELKLPTARWQVVFQSRFGREEWLRPYTDETLTQLGQAAVKRIDVICPGFAADCLETLEEINEENRQLFLTAGGREFHYIPALNDSPGHIQALWKILFNSPYAPPPPTPPW